MIDEKTTYLKLPLPHPDNLLEDDVLRLRETLQGLDANAKTQDDALKTQSDGLQGVEEELQQQKQDLRDLLAAAVTSAFSGAWRLRSLTSLSGIRLTWQFSPRSRAASSSACESAQLTPRISAYSTITRRPVFST